MEVPCDTDERLLNQVLGLVPISGLAGDEMYKPVAIPVVEVLESTVPAVKMGGHELLVAQSVEGFFVRPRKTIVVYLTLSHMYPDGIGSLAETGPIPLDDGSHIRSEYAPS